MEQIRSKHSRLTFILDIQKKKKKNLESISTSPNSASNVCISVGSKFQARLRVGVSHVRGHKYHNFRDSLNPI